MVDDDYAPPERMTLEELVGEWNRLYPDQAIADWTGPRRRLESMARMGQKMAYAPGTPPEPGPPRREQ